MWQWIDTDKSGSVTIAEFFEGFEMLNEPFRQKTLDSETTAAGFARLVWGLFWTSRGLMAWS